MYSLSFKYSNSFNNISFGLLMNYSSSLSLLADSLFLFDNLVFLSLFYIYLFIYFIIYFIYYSSSLSIDYPIHPIAPHHLLYFDCCWIYYLFWIIRFSFYFWFLIFGLLFSFYYFWFLVWLKQTASIIYFVTVSLIGYLQYIQHDDWLFVLSFLYLFFDYLFDVLVDSYYLVWLLVDYLVRIIILVLFSYFYFINLVCYLVCDIMIYLYLILSIIQLDSLSTIYLCFPQSFHFLNLCLNGVGNLVFDNSLFIFIILFFIVGMININLIFLGC